MATKKSPARKPAAKKSSPRKRAAKRPAHNAVATPKSEGALHDVARSIGSTLGSIAKKTGKAVEAAEDALPGPLRGEF